MNLPETESQTNKAENTMKSDRVIPIGPGPIQVAAMTLLAFEKIRRWQRGEIMRMFGVPKEYWTEGFTQSCVARTRMEKRKGILDGTN